MIETIKSFFITDSDEWKNRVQNVGNFDFYHLPDYAKLDASITGSEAISWIAEVDDQQIFIPLLKRQIPDKVTKDKEYYDLTSPYGYPGMVISNDISTELLNTVIAKFHNDCKKEEFISSFLRLNPIINPYFFREKEFVNQTIHGNTVLVPLQKNYDDLRMDYSSNHRRNLKKLTKSNFKVSDGNESFVESFYEIYSDSMDRLEASDYYHFDKNYFKKLIEILDGNATNLLVKNSDDMPVAGGIFTRFNGVIQYHLGGTLQSYMKKAPSKLMFDWIIRKYSKDNEHTYFHLGGGLGGNDDSLFRFKAGFSDTYCKFTSLRMIHQKQRFNNLVHNVEVEFDKDLSESEFFPPYREPIK